MKKTKEQSRCETNRFQDRLSLIELLGRQIEETGEGLLYPTGVGDITVEENEQLKKMMQKNPALLLNLRRGGDV